MIEAGYQPNKWTGRLDSKEFLTGVIAACRHFGRLPTYDEMDIYRTSAPSVPSASHLQRYFGTRSDLIAALSNRVRDDETCADIAAMLPIIPSAARTTLPTRTKSPDGFVYLIKSGDFHKVGKSEDLERRIKEIRVALPDKATLIHSIRTDDPGGIEAYWHQRFKDKRANGEWFRLSSSDVSAFKRRKFQ